MAHSSYLDHLSKNDYDELKRELHSQQNGTCFICRHSIDLDIEKTDIDHIEPLKNGGKDSPLNFALTHASCNRRKQDADLRVAQVLEVLNDIQKNKEGKAATLADILDYYGGSKKDPKFRISDDVFSIAFGDELKREYPIFTDHLSGEQTVFLDAPIEYIFHDSLINPRGINTRINGLIKEFHKGNPQLQVCLARLDNGRIKIFDGQHKTVAQILLGQRVVPMRLFIAPDVQRLTTTNTNAGSKLKQVAFDKSIMHQLSNTLYGERITRYQKDHDLAPDDFSFSEHALIEYFKGQDVRKLIIEAQKYAVTHSMENKLTPYINFDGKRTELPISYSTFNKAFLSLFIDPKHTLNTPLDFKEETNLNPREIEREQIIRLLNIIAERIYVNRFDPEIGTYRIENRVSKGNDAEITNEHLAAYRMSKEEILLALIPLLVRLIEFTLTLAGENYPSAGLFMHPFPENTWSAIDRFINSYAGLPLWKNRALSETIFSGKQNKSYWTEVFSTGKTPDGSPVLESPLSIMDMIR